METLFVRLKPYDPRRGRGLCLICGRPVAKGHRHCRRHLTYYLNSK
jgi:hypothetical protein